MNIIVAVCKNRGIGKNNALPWVLKQDMKFFKEKTIGNGKNVIVMGNNTFKSLDKPLPKRKNIIFTRKNDNEIVRMNANSKVSKHDINNPIYFNNLNNFENYVKNKKYENIWIIGGSEIYQKFLPFTNKIYLTKIYNNFDCDTFFPPIPNNFNLIECSSIKKENYINFRYKTFINESVCKIDDEHKQKLNTHKVSWGCMNYKS